MVQDGQQRLVCQRPPRSSVRKASRKRLTCLSTMSGEKPRTRRAPGSTLGSGKQGCLRTHLMTQQASHPSDVKWACQALTPPDLDISAYPKRRSADRAPQPWASHPSTRAGTLEGTRDVGSALLQAPIGAGLSITPEPRLCPFSHKGPSLSDPGGGRPPNAGRGDQNPPLAPHSLFLLSPATVPLQVRTASFQETGAGAFLRAEWAVWDPCPGLSWGLGGGLARQHPPGGQQ